MANLRILDNSHVNGADLLIVGGILYDGTGSVGVSADIAIAGDRIAAIGPNLRATMTAGRVIDATGLIVSPGFIDIHTHSDLSVLINPRMESSIHQGVTTEVVGNCGMAAGVITPDAAFALERRWLERGGIAPDWTSFGGFLSRVEESGVAINICSLTGHGSIRKKVMGSANRVPSATEAAEMLDIVTRCMDEGAVGLSTGLEYLPGGYANVDEIVPLAEAARLAGGFYASHIRNEGDTLVESIAEAIAVGERTGIAVQLSHHKAEGHKNWGKIQTTLKMMADARSRGLDVLTDQYPYTAFMTGLPVIILPAWAMGGEPEDMVARLQEPESRAKVLEEIALDPPDWALIQVGIARNRRDLQGKTLAEVAEVEGKSPAEAALDLIIGESGWVGAAHFALSEADVETIMADPHTMIGSDGVSASPDGILGEDKTHPRTYGTFPRVLGEYVREKGVLTLGEAIRRMTALPAKRIGLIDRGRLAVGMKADIVVFNAGTVADVADFDNPHRFAIGIEQVIVNGRVALSGGVQVDVREGRVLRRAAAGVA
ncbi:MAG TPA: D-aminoacylase [Capsulimonadaceae bacterium]|jgi:N-acyl-D-amino-acid deacylase